MCFSFSLWTTVEKTKAAVSSPSSTSSDQGKKEKKKKQDEQEEEGQQTPSKRSHIFYIVQFKLHINVFVLI